MPGDLWGSTGEVAAHGASGDTGGQGQEGGVPGLGTAEPHIVPGELVPCHPVPQFPLAQGTRGWGWSGRSETGARTRRGVSAALISRWSYQGILL